MQVQPKMSDFRSDSPAVPAEREERSDLSLMSLCHCVTVLCYCVTVLRVYSVAVSLCYCVVSLCYCVTVLLCH
jgi:hypothetical protein